MRLRKVFEPRGFKFFLSATLCILSASSGAAQIPQSRITQSITESQRVTLSGHVHPLAKPKYDQGAISDSAPANRILLLLSRTDAQQAALDKLLEEQQTQGSANYHRWLTPEEFGARFGASDADLQKITDWLTSKGFKVEQVAASKTLIEFSGTAAQVRNAFQTELHSYALPSGTYTANNADPQIPVALAPVVKGFVSLNNFPRHSSARVRGAATRSATGSVRPLWTSTSGGFFAIGPGDFATIYNSLPLIKTGINGAGQTIGIVGQSNISLTDVANFRSLFGLPALAPTVVVDGTDPGLVTSGDEGESALDVQWSGATAPGANIKLVIAKTTSTTSGVDLAAQYLVNHNLADILSESYGACELQMGTLGNSFYNSLWQQASALGITVVVATGDNGSAGCEDQTTATVSESSSGGVAVSGLASTPYNVAVGGTDFNDASSTSSYWSSSNFTDPTTGEKHISALGYIPEMTWNDSCAHSATAGFLTPCATVTDTNSKNYNSLQLWAGSGGPSNCVTSTSSGVCTAGYSKPSWQTGSGVPNDGVRDIPDVSLFAATGESGSNSFYVACQADDQGSSCVPDNTGSVPFIGVSGTSAAAPNFAAIIALAEQQIGNQRLGNINYLLYKIAAQSGASCASSGTAASSCVFYDTQVGNISVPCNPGSPNCSVSTGTAKGVLVASGAPAYMTTAGYDTATGLGSVNVNNLVAAIAGLEVPTVATPTANPSTVNQGGSTTLSVAVTGNSSLGVPTGTITFLDGASTIGTATNTSTSGNVLTGTRSYTPSTSGTHTITATISAAGGYVAATSSGLTLTVTSLPAPTISTPSATSTSVTVGHATTISVTVTGTSTPGVPSGTIKFYDGTSLIGTATTTSNAATFTLTGTLSYAPSTTGSHSVTAQYSGDSNYGSVTSGALTITATALPTPTTTASATATSITVGNSTTLSATVTGTSTAGVPGGTIKFYDGTSLIGTATTTSNAANYSLTGTLSYAPSTPITAATQHSITAQYSGDSNYASVTSGTLTVTANPAFTQGVASSAINIGSAGGTGVNTITFTPASSGLPASTAISYSCTSSSTAASCTPSSAQSIPISNSAVTANINYTVPALGGGAKVGLRSSPWKFGGGILFAGVILFAVPGVRRRSQVAVMLILLSAVVIGVGCGGGGSSSTTPTPQTFTFTVTATTTAYGVTTTQTNSFTVTN